MKPRHFIIVVAALSASTALPVTMYSGEHLIGVGGVEFGFALLWLSGCLMGTAISWRIAKAFKDGRLSLPWSLITGAFIAFAVNSFLPFAQYYDFIQTPENIGRVASLVGMLMLLGGGWLYKKAILR